jgi:hypothetical protein
MRGSTALTSFKPVNREIRPDGIAGKTAVLFLLLIWRREKKHV